MFRFIKSLEKEAYIAAVLTLVIIGLATEGFGGDGRMALTAMAETPEAARESDDRVGDVLDDGDGGRIEEPDGGGMTASGSSDEETAGEPADAEYGKKVVGYFLTKDVKGQNGAGGDHEGEGGEASAVPAAAERGHSLSQKDYQVLLKIVEAEAGVCDDKGKILVANVILNRVKSDQFPDSVTDVVYQPSQFSPVSNGSINTCQVSSETVESVNRALKGEDYSQGALFFMNRSASRNKAVQWFDGRLTYLFGYQGHEFFK